MILSDDVQASILCGNLDLVGAEEYMDRSVGESFVQETLDIALGNVVNKCFGNGEGGELQFCHNIIQGTEAFLEVIGRGLMQG